METTLAAIETDELMLFPLTLEQMENFNENPEKVAISLGVRDSELYNPKTLQNLNEKHILPRLRKALPEDTVFCTRWLAVSKYMNRVVADLLIKKGPDAEGEIEIGYGVYPRYEGKGWMTKVVKAFLEWANKQPRIKTVMAETAQNNKPSIRVLQKNGFALSRQTDNFYYWRIKTSNLK